MKVLLPILSIALLVSGCSFNAVGNSEFACPGMPKGVTCKSPREVYNGTNGDMSVATKSSKNKNKFAGVPTYVFANQPRSGGSLEPVPVLEQAHVMRIWIAPWVDKNKDLHWPGVVFTQVAPRQWHFGDEEFDGGEIPIPHKYLANDVPNPSVAIPVLPTKNKAEVVAQPAELPKQGEEPLN